MRSERGAKRLDIQGLRAVAVVAVILDHLAGWPGGGFVGVDVFFVISGFLITGLLLREYETSGTISFARFYRRRVKRIVPAATLVLVATLAAGYVLLGQRRLVAIAWDALASFAFVGNWRFAAQGTDYFQEGSPPSPLQHYWSLSVEEQFYFVWPWLLLGLLVAGARWLGWQRRHTRLVAGVAIGVLTAASLGWALAQSASRPEVAYFSTLTRAWELGVGALVAVLAPRLAGVGRPALRVGLAWVGLGGIVASVLVVPAQGGFPAPWALLPVLSTGLVIGAGAASYLWPLTNRLSAWLGEVSYSLYLWHFPVIVLLPAVMASDTAAFYALAAGLTLVLAAASYRLVEAPARRADWFVRRRGRGVRPAVGWAYVAVAGVALVALAGVGGRVVGTGTEGPLVPAAALTGDRIRAVDDPYRCVGAGAMDPRYDCPLNEGDAVSPPVDRMEQDGGGAFVCWIGAREPLEVCHQGSERADALRVAVVGDSHAALLMPSLVPSLERLNWSVDSYTGVMCQWWTLESPKCPAGPDIRERLETGEPYDLVITTSIRRSAIEATPEDYAEAWRPVAARGTRIVVVADVAEPSEESLQCVTRVGFRPSEGECGTPESAAFARPDVPVQAAALVDGVEVVDLRDFLCRDGVCPAVVGNVIVYQDLAGHLTGTFARTLGPYLVRELEEVVGAG